MQEEYDKNSYFTPEIEDIRVGYECESMIMTESTDGGENWFSQWGKYIVEYHKFPEIGGLLEMGWIRTLFLTKEQIEAEGWKSYENSNEVFDKGRWRVSIVNLDRNEMWINEIDKTYGNPNRIYAGECKDINTFRYICKLLKIN